MDDKTQIQLINSIYSLIKPISELLKTSIDNNNTRQVLKSTKELLCQLNTDYLSPQSYHQIFTLIFENILQVQSYFLNEVKKGRNSLNLYFSVQQCLTALPRAYLMIMMGSIILENDSIDKKELFEDLLEVCNNIKNPIKGLFLRFFLVKILNNYFTDFDLLMINFKEMIRLWINIKKLKNISEKNINKYRSYLKVLIGDHITKFANTLNDLKIDDKESIYKEKILIPILSIIKAYKDVESQEYILICIIQAFNEEYNIKYIEDIIETLIKIKENIDIKKILNDLMKKLSKFKQIEKIKGIKMDLIFSKINECIAASINKKLDKINELKISGEKYIYFDINDKEIISLIETQHSFIKFIINFGSFENKKEVTDILNKNIDKLYELLDSIKSFNKEINQISIEKYVLNNDNMITIYDLLNELASSPLSIIEFKSFPFLMKMLNITYFYELSLSIINNLTNENNKRNIDTIEKCKRLIEFLEPILLINHADLREYLSNKLIYRISKIVFVPSSKDPYEQFEMLMMIKDKLIESTKNDNEILTEKKKIIYLGGCLNSFFILGLNVSETFANQNKGEKNNEKIPKIHLDFCNNYYFNKKNFNVKKEASFLPFYSSLFKEIDSILEIIKNISPEETFKFYIESSKMINSLKFDNTDKYEDYAYNYINKAIGILNAEKNSNEINLNKEDNNDIITININKRYEYLIYLIGAISYMNIFSEDHLNLIKENIENICENFPKRNEQCLLMLKCLNLYCNEEELDLNKLINLFSKAKKYAIYSMINPENTILFVYILNEYIRLDGYIKDFDKTVKLEDIEEIIETVENYLTNMKNENKDEKMIKHIEVYYNNTIEKIKIIKNNKKRKNYKLISNLKLV